YDDGATVTLAAGETYLNADFGYNWATVADTDNPNTTATGAIGDRIWNDADGDGIQDPGESGLENITVSLLTDDNNDGVYGGAGDNTAVTTTDATGHYIFDGLEPDGYVIEVTAPTGTVQTGDPDEPGIAAISGDNRTTAPVILAPGDTYVNADFGYHITGGATAVSTIGDRIYLDADGDGIDDGIVAEPGFAGVTVALKNGSGEVIAYDITDKDGNYLFTGLPSDTYSVEVTDTRNLLGQFTQTGDPDGTTDGSHTLPAATTPGTNIDTVDFGYAPPGHNSGEGLIGDTIFLDFNGNGSVNVGEGLEGVTVQLYDSGGTVLVRSTVTNSGGVYSFGNLDPTATYTVKVDTDTLPASGTGLTNSVDPETLVTGNGDSASVVDLNASGGINLTQDFGYIAAAPNFLSGTLWNDIDGDGTLESGEPERFSGITIILRDSDGDIVGTTVTDVNG
ncbi:MAG: hypothetical protein D3924_19140, partial [Candidatus Electrothrix sp. AR4]|nr:hypothetical protein [Candidatus Electrothrix sp. AR4]